MEWWEFLLVMALVIPVMVLWLGCIIDAISRPDMSGWLKAAWVLFILFFPIVGSLVYIIMRPRVIIATPGTGDTVWGQNPDTLPTSANRTSNYL